MESGYLDIVRAFSFSSRKGGRQCAAEKGVALVLISAFHGPKSKKEESFEWQVI